jgi:hypothetical protein
MCNNFCHREEVACKVAAVLKIMAWLRGVSRVRDYSDGRVLHNSYLQSRCLDCNKGLLRVPEELRGKRILIVAMLHNIDVCMPLEWDHGFTMLNQPPTGQDEAGRTVGLC